MSTLDLITLAFTSYSACFILNLLATRRKAEGLIVAPLFLLPYLVLVDLLTRSAS